MPYDYSKLIGIIIEKFKTRGNFATVLGLSERSLSLKLNGKVSWTQKEITKACELLSISGADIPAYFFAREVQ